MAAGSRGFMRINKRRPTAEKTKSGLREGQRPHVPDILNPGMTLQVDMFGCCRAAAVVPVGGPGCGCACGEDGVSDARRDQGHYKHAGYRCDYDIDFEQCGLR